MRLWEWNEGQSDAPTKTKSLSSERAASYSTPSIHKFTSHFSSGLRASQEGFTHSHVGQAHTLACTELHTRASSLDLMRESQNQREGKQWNIWILSQTVAGVRSGSWCYSFINMHPDWTSSARSANRPPHSRQLYSAELHRAAFTAVCSRAAQDYHTESQIWFQDISAYVFTVMHWPWSINSVSFTN